MNVFLLTKQKPTKNYNRLILISEHRNDPTLTTHYSYIFFLNAKTSELQQNKLFDATKSVFSVTNCNKNIPCIMPTLFSFLIVITDIHQTLLDNRHRTTPKITPSSCNRTAASTSFFTSIVVTTRCKETR
jgi:hypothetical protein